MNPRHVLVIVLVILGGVAWGSWFFREDLPIGQRGSIVSLAPNLTECVHFFGLEERLVGVTQFCEADSTIPRVGDVKPNLERIVKLQPEVILAIESAAIRNAITVLEAEGLKVEVFPSETFSDVRRMVARMGELWNRESKAEEFLQRFDAALAAPPIENPVEVMFVVDWGPTHCVAGGGSFVGEMLEAVGAKNCMGDVSAAYTYLDGEGIAKRDPDWILDSSMMSSKNLDHWEVLEHLRAVQDRRVRPFPPVQPGLRIPEWLEQLRELLSGRQP